MNDFKTKIEEIKVFVLNLSGWENTHDDSVNSKLYFICYQGSLTRAVSPLCQMAPLVVGEIIPEFSKNKTCIF